MNFSEVLEGNLSEKFLFQDLKNLKDSEWRSFISFFYCKDDRDFTLELYKERFLTSLYDRKGAGVVIFDCKSNIVGYFDFAQLNNFTRIFHFKVKKVNDALVVAKSAIRVLLYVKMALNGNTMIYVSDKDDDSRQLLDILGVMRVVQNDYYYVNIDNSFQCLIHDKIKKFKISDKYRIVRSKNMIPSELIDGYCDLYCILRNDLPRGDGLVFKKESKEEVRKELKLLEKIGYTKYFLFLLKNDLIVGFNVCGVSKRNITKGYQLFNGVLRSERGNRFGVYMKAQNYSHIIEKHPGLTMVYTDVLGNNKYSKMVNDEFNFCYDRSNIEYSF